MKKLLIQNTVKEFASIFKKEPTSVFLSPGRINIIGEHVDYNDGFVLPAAINKYVCFAISPSDDNQNHWFSKDLNDAYHFSNISIIQPITKMWANYLLGVVAEFQKRNLAIKPFNLVFSSNIPMGAGLSSSAALECGLAYALNKLNNHQLPKEELALIGQKAEHLFAGVNCGIMDQFASVFGKKNKVIKLDCNSLNYHYFDANLNDYRLVLLDSCVKHSHLTSGYNDRRNEVEQGMKIIKHHFPEVTSFRDCTLEQINSIKNQLGPIIFKRCEFVIEEINRVSVAAHALNENNYQLLGQKMSETHVGLSKKYEVSCEEIDFLVDEILKNNQVLGARMMGGGFGGCSINLIHKDAMKVTIEDMKKKYKNKFGIDLKVYKIKIAKGSHQFKEDFVSMIK